MSRPPHPRNVHDLTDAETPELLFADTSFIVHALIAKERQHEPCARFLARAVERDCIFVTDSLIEVELREVAYKIALKERWGSSHWQEHRRDGRSRARGANLAETLLDRWLGLLESSPSVTIEVGETHPLVGPLMAGYGLASYDAVHVAAIRLVSRAGAAGIATLDTGFGAIHEDDPAIYTTRNLTTACRARRARKRVTLPLTEDAGA